MTKVRAMSIAVALKSGVGRTHIYCFEGRPPVLVWCAYEHRFVGFHRIKCHNCLRIRRKNMEPMMR